VGAARGAGAPGIDEGDADVPGLLLEAGVGGRAVVLGEDVEEGGTGAPVGIDWEQQVGANEALPIAGEPAEEAALAAVDELPAIEEGVNIIDCDRRVNRGKTHARGIECRLADQQVLGVVEADAAPEAQLIAAAVEPAQLGPELREIRLVVPVVVEE